MKQVKLSEVIALFEAGKTREEIKTHFDLSHSELKTIFAHPTLKGKRVKKPTFTFIDDVTEIGVNQTTIFDIIGKEESVTEASVEEVSPVQIEDTAINTEDFETEEANNSKEWSY